MRSKLSSVHLTPAYPHSSLGKMEEPSLGIGLEMTTTVVQMKVFLMGTQAQLLKPDVTG